MIVFSLGWICLVGSGPRESGMFRRTWPPAPATLPPPRPETRFHPMTTAATPPSREVRDSVVIRFAGDSGDGMQVTGTQFTLETALAGNDLSTFPDFPAEIRAPAGTTFGVSAFQIQFGAVD